MAVQMDVAHSSIMRGVGVIAGVAYGCADPRQLLAGLGGRVARGLDCMDGGVSFGGFCRCRLFSKENERSRR